MVAKIFYITVILALLGVFGCGKKSATTEQKPQDQQKAASTAQAAPAAPQPEEFKVEKEIFIYESKGKKDPFASVIDINKEKVAKKKKSINPVENADVEELKLIAIIWDKTQYYAMITLPDNKSYTIKKGMTLGVNGGKVKEITKDAVTVTEQVSDFRGKLKTKDTTLKLRKEEEE